MALTNATRLVGLLMVAGFLVGGLAESTVLQIIGFTIAGGLALVAILLARRQSEEDE